MGGDFAPGVVLEGVSNFLEHGFSNVVLALFGDENVKKSIKGGFWDTSQVEFYHTSEVITMEDIPLQAVQAKTNSSIVLGMETLGRGEIDSFASAGNTGAMMMAMHKHISMLKGIKRPGICTVYKTFSGSENLLLDSGLFADAKPETLEEYSILGTAYAKSILKKENPKVGLLNIGSEKSKGSQNHLATHELLSSNKQINFIGNVEGDAIFGDKADIILCDGFAGNVVIKLCGSIGLMLRKTVEDKKVTTLFDYEKHGGAQVLGVDRNVIIAHGKSSPKAIERMILFSKSVAESNLNEILKNEVTRFNKSHG